MGSALFARSRGHCNARDAKFFSSAASPLYTRPMLKSPARWLPLLAVLSGVPAAHPAAPAKTGPAQAKTGAKPEVVGFWRFERDVKPEGRSAAFGPATRLNDGVYFFSDEVPGPFIYDPLQNGWLIKLAREAAKAQGLELVAQEARTLTAAP